jgi:hypothetical protein
VSFLSSALAPPRRPPPHQSFHLIFPNKPLRCSSLSPAVAELLHCAALHFTALGPKLIRPAAPKISLCTVQAVARLLSNELPPLARARSRVRAATILPLANIALLLTCIARPDRRSIAAFQAPPLPSGPATTTDEPNFSSHNDSAAAGLDRSSTVVRRDGNAPGNGNTSPAFELPAQPSPSPSWAPQFNHPNSSEQSVVPRADTASMNHAPGKTSSDSGQQAALDRWSQRRLQRLNTEQGFREQRQGGSIASPPASDTSSFSSPPVGYPHQNAQPQSQASLHQQPPPHHQGSYQANSRSNAAPAIHSQPVSTARSSSYPVHEQPQVAHIAPQHQYSPQDAQFQENGRPQVQQSRSYSQQSAIEEQHAMASANNGSISAPKAVRAAGNNNRQSLQNNSLPQRDNQSGMQSFSANVVPPTAQAPPSYQSSQPTQQGDVRRATPQPVQSSEDLSEEDVAQLVKDHKELRKLTFV